MLDRVEQAKKVFRRVNEETKELQELRSKAGSIAIQLTSDRAELSKIESLISVHQKTAADKAAVLHSLMSKLDLYSRLDEFVDYGYFEVPEYLYETGERYAAEIKVIRDKQKGMIKDGSAFVQDGRVSLTGDDGVDKKIIDGQMKIIMRAFNVECDMLVGRVSPSSFDRTLGQIEKMAADLRMV